MPITEMTYSCNKHAPLHRQGYKCFDKHTEYSVFKRGGCEVRDKKSRRKPKPAVMDLKNMFTADFGNCRQTR